MKFLLCPPTYYGIEYEINPWMNRQVGSDPSESGRQWKALHDLLIDLGVTIERVEPAWTPSTACCRAG